MPPPLTTSEILQIKEQLFGSFRGIDKLQDLLTRGYGGRYSNLPQEALIEEVIRNISEPYKTFEIDTSITQNTPKEYQISGGVFQIAEVTNNDVNAYIDVRFNRPQSSPIKMSLGDRIVTPFRSIWVSWPAQSGITFTIATGLEFENVFKFDKNLQTIISNVSLIDQINRLTRIPAGATEIAGRVFAVTGSANPTPIYTVTANKTLYVSKIMQGGFYSASSISLQEFRHTDSAGNLIKVLHAVHVTNTATFSINLLPAYPISAGEKLELNSRDQADASLTAPYRYAYFTGWEE